MADEVVKPLFMFQKMLIVTSLRSGRMEISEFAIKCGIKQLFKNGHAGIKLFVKYGKLMSELLQLLFEQSQGCVVKCFNITY